MQSFDLLYVDPKALPKIRKLPSFPKQPKKNALPLLAIDGLEGKDEDAVAEAIDKGVPVDSHGITSAIQQNMRHDGRFAPPVVMVEGELKLVFDAVEQLKVTITTALPFATGDEELSGTIKAARDFLETSGDVPSPSVAETMASRIREAFSRIRRAVPSDYVEREVHRALVEQRRNKMAQVAGVPYARGLLTIPGDRASVLFLTPKPALPYLPLSSRVQGRFLADAAPGANEYDNQPFVLRAIAFSRALPR